MIADLNDFLTTFPLDYPLLWALLVTAAVAATSLALYVLWELLLRFRLPFGSSGNKHQGGLE